MIYTSNSIRVIENYITSSYEEGEKYINEVFNASYNNTSYNVLNEANIITTIKNSIVKFFKWLWSKITEAAGKIKKFLLNIFNKIRGIKVDDKKNSTSSKENKNEENKKVEIIILDFDKAEDTIRELSMDAFFNNTAGIRSLHNSAIARIKDIINSILNSGLAKVTNAIANGGEGDELSDSFSKNAKDNANKALNDLYKELDGIKEKIKKINNEKFANLLDLDKKEYDINEVNEVLKQKYSFYEKDGSIKKEYQKKVTIDSSDESREQFKKWQEHAMKLTKLLNQKVAENTEYLANEINDYKKLSIDIMDAINVLTDKIASIDKKIAEKIAKKAKEAAEEATRKANEAARIKAEQERIAAENAAKLAASLEEIAKTISNAKTGEEIEKVYNDNELDMAGYWGSDETNKKFDAFIKNLDKDKLSMLIKSAGFSVEEFVCLSQMKDLYSGFSIERNKINLLKINDSYHKIANSALNKIKKLIALSKDAETEREDKNYQRASMLFNLARNKKVKEILKEYYDKIINKSNIMDVKVDADIDGISKIFKDLKVDYNRIKLLYVFEVLEFLNGRYLNVDSLDKDKYRNIYDYFDDIFRTNIVHYYGIDNLSLYQMLPKIYPNIKKDSKSIYMHYRDKIKKQLDDIQNSRMFAGKKFDTEKAISDFEKEYFAESSFNYKNSNIFSEIKFI